MKATSLLHRVCLLSFAGTLAFCLLPAEAGAAATPGDIVQSKLGGGTIPDSPALKLISAVRDCAKEKPNLAPGFVTAALSGGRADTDAIAPRVTVAAIEGLGANPAPVAVSAIVSASVKAAPAVMLETVRMSVKAAPGCANAIVRAAVKAVPNPNEQIETTTETKPPVARGYAKDESKETPQPAQLLPIAEAIAQAAYQGDPSLSYPDLLAVANAAVGGGGGFDVTSVYPGYYYPPLVSVKTGTTAVALPTPPVVSK